MLTHPPAPVHREDATVDTKNDTAPSTHPATEECFVCLGGVVYIGHLVEDDETGEAVEIVEAVSCRRCAKEEL